ncbi:MAG: MarR family transcriptional regulator [Gaiellaceae bacterium MAG52_C11]|nr:MarR family transcriptional regulator [Candidatus Gaiellasilicea maunaloa]
MDTISGTEAARRLETSVPRVKRAIDRLGLEVERGRGGRVRLTAQQLNELRGELGAVAPIEGLTRVETQVLAGLARAPRGLASARAVARRAGVSPTAAAAAVGSLVGRGVVRREREWVAAGRARELELVRADTSAPGWPALAPRLAAVRLPRARPQRTSTRVPARLRHLFWNADPQRVDVRAHGAYIAERVLSAGDLDGLAWGLRVLRAADWEQASRTRGLSSAQRALARNLARSARG